MVAVAWQPRQWRQPWHQLAKILVSSYIYIYIWVLLLRLLPAQGGGGEGIRYKCHVRAQLGAAQWSAVAARETAALQVANQGAGGSQPRTAQGPSIRQSEGRGWALGPRSDADDCRHSL